MFFLSSFVPFVSLLTKESMYHQSAGAAAGIMLDALVSKVCRTLSIEPVDLDPERPLHSYGIDSLMEVELGSWVFQI